MGLFKKKQERKEERQGGPFVSFILMNDLTFSAEQLLADLKEDWGMDLPSKDADEEAHTFISTINGMLATVSLMPGPVPNGEAVENARTNFRWPEAVNVAEGHKAHLLVAVLSSDKSLIDEGVLMVKLCTSGLKQAGAVGVNALGSVLEPQVYRDFAKSYLSEGLFPVMNLVFFGLYSRDGGKTVSGYTYGMDTFCKKELEVLDSAHSGEELMEFLTSISTYVIEEDVLLQNGETIGFSAEQKLSIIESSGEALSGSTLKIGF